MAFPNKIEHIRPQILPPKSLTVDLSRTLVYLLAYLDEVAHSHSFVLKLKGQAIKDMYLLTQVQILFYNYIFTTFAIILLSLTANAHEGHSHSSAPTASARSSFKNSIESESPFSPTLKLRSGYEFGTFASFLPGFNTFLGHDEISLNLNYEFQFREFNTNQNSQQESSFSDRDFDHHAAAQIKKTLSDNLDFSTTAEYETSEATRLARSINDFYYISINPNLIYKLSEDWHLTGGYTFNQRHYPNGTYLVPLPSPTGAGEPIDPNQDPITTITPITREGISDVQNQIMLSIDGNLNDTTLHFEGKSLTNNSDLQSREYNALGAKLALERLLLGRLFGQLSYAFENRIFSERTDQVHITELGLQQELSARLSLSGIMRSNQLKTITSTSYVEGYAQVQYAF